jgi:hypothetical protein
VDRQFFSLFSISSNEMNPPRTRSTSAYPTLPQSHSKI